MNYIKLLFLPLFISIVSLILILSGSLPPIKDLLLLIHTISDLAIIVILFVATCHHFNAISDYKRNLANIGACKKMLLNYESSLSRTKEVVGEICMVTYPEMEKSLVESLFPNKGDDNKSIKDFKQSYPELRSADLIKGYLAQINNLLNDIKYTNNQISTLEKENFIILTNRWVWLSLPIDGNV